MLLDPDWVAPHQNTVTHVDPHAPLAGLPPGEGNHLPARLPCFTLLHVLLGALWTLDSHECFIILTQALKHCKRGSKIWRCGGMMGWGEGGLDSEG